MTRKIILMLGFLLSNQVAQAQWYNPISWFRNPTASSIPSKTELVSMLVHQQAAVRGNDIFFVNKGFIFKFEGQNVRYIDDSSNVKSIIVYKNVLIALNNKGRIFLRGEPKNQNAVWLDIGNNATKIAADAQNLYALTEGREVWRYKGEPGEIIIGYRSNPITVSCGNNCTTTIDDEQPYVMGHEIAFQKLNVGESKDIKQIVDHGIRKVQVVTAVGQTYTFRQ